jgi:hypothetical protein
MEGKAMKRILTLMVAMVLFLFVPLGCAQNENNNSSEENEKLLEELFSTIDKLCKEESRFALIVMAGSQEGLPMSICFEEISNQKSLKNKERLRGIVMEAYAKPRFSTELNRKEAMEDFANKVYFECSLSMREEALKVLKESK